MLYFIENFASFVLWKFQIKSENCVSSEQGGSELTFLYQPELAVNFFLLVLQNWWILHCLFTATKCVMRLFKSALAYQ